MSKFLSVCLYFTFCLVSIFAQESETPLFYAAEDAWKAHKWEEALAKYRAIANSQSSGPSVYPSKAHIQIGKYYKYQKRCMEAIAEYEMAIAKAVSIREVEDAMTGIGAVYICSENYPKAMEIFRKVLAQTRDWQQVKYCTYWMKTLKRRSVWGSKKSEGKCGYNAIKKVFELKGIKFTEKEINPLLGSREGGASMQELQEIAKSKGLKVEGVRLSVKQIESMEKPFIALLDNPKHYVIVTGFEQEDLRIIDPENVGVSYRLPKRKFSEMWKGHALVFGAIKSDAVMAFLSPDEMKHLQGRVCDCCPASENGTNNPNTNYNGKCVNPALLVNTVSLNLVIQDIDLSYTGRGPDVVVMRTYNADDPNDGPFGPSWTFNYNTSLTENPDGSVHLREGTGTILRYTSAGGGNYNPPPAIYDTLVKNGDNTYSWKLKRSKLTCKFSDLGKLTHITDRNGNSITMGYDGSNRLVTITDAAGRVTTIGYGGNGKIGSITDPVGRTVSYSYDGNNNLISCVNTGGDTVSYVYDVCNYMNKITTVNGTTEMAYTTSPEGYSLISITDALSNTRYYGTYQDDSTIRIKDGNGNPQIYENNGSGYNARILDALGNTFTYGYDTGGNRTSIQDANGKTTSLEYDARGNITRITDSLNHIIQFTYDSRDNLIQLVDAAMNTYTYEYDSNDNLTKIKDPENGETTFGYNSYGELISLTDPRNNSYSFTYDTYGNLVTVINPLGKMEAYSHDEIGRVTLHGDPNDVTLHYGYDGLDRLTQVIYPDGFVKRYSYDCCGLLKVTDRSGSVAFTRDADHRVIRIVDVYGKSISYGYDKVGNLTSLTYPDGKQVRYEYDTASRLTKLTDWLNNVTTYEYNGKGSLVKTVYPDGSVVIHQYDDANRLTSISGFKADGTVNAMFEYTLDDVGNRTGISSYQPLTAIPPVTNTTSTYGDDNRLLTENTITYDHDNTGNLVKRTDGGDITAYTWDYNNRLTRLGRGGNSYRYRYDGIGNRISKTENSTETRYVVDPRSSLSQILAEMDGNGNITAYYVYGLGLLSKITPSGQAYHYHYDGLGSTVFITDSSGSVVNKYAYDAFGKAVSSQETITNPFRYVGRWGVMDEGSGLFYMRARYYDSETGRFLSNDPIGFASGLNLYAYVVNNPVNFLDPSGLTALQYYNNAYLAAMDEAAQGSEIDFISKGEELYENKYKPLAKAKDLAAQAKIGAAITIYSSLQVAGGLSGDAAGKVSIVAGAFGVLNDFFMGKKTCP